MRKRLLILGVIVAGFIVGFTVYNAKSGSGVFESSLVNKSTSSY
ncbi:hypothetical protein [Marinoscillum sp.]